MPLAGHWEIVVLVVLALVLFGGGMLPKVARSAGRTVREVRSVKDDLLALEVGAGDAERSPDDDAQKPAAKAPTITP